MRLCFVDDWALSGKQSATGLQSMFGVKPTLAEEVKSFWVKLKKEELKRLREQGLVFFFLGTTAKAERRIKKICVQLKVNVEIQKEVDLDQFTLRAWLKSADDTVTKRARQRLIAFLKIVGTSVLQTTKRAENPRKWTRHRCQRCALGYGDSQLLVSSFFNTPTGTVTALWRSDGLLRGDPWESLLPRNEGEIDGAAKLQSDSALEPVPPR
jgi:hypothetical protein